MVRWVTVSEIGTQGFNLYRAGSWNGPWTKLNDRLIESKAPSGVLLGAEYSWLDESATPGIRYFYQLEQIDAGRTRWHGPTMAGCYWLYLPSLLRAR